MMHFSSFSPVFLAVAWLAPLAATILALSTIPPLVALYFLRLRRTRRVISSTMLWKRATQDLRANAPFQRLRFSILLLLQLLALVLLILAVAQPQVDLGETQASRVVLLVDQSGSMNAKDASGDRSRLDEAKRLAEDRLRALHGGGLFSGPAPAVMVIAFAKDARIVCPFTDNMTQAVDGVRAIEPTDEATALSDAFELARAFTTVTNPDAPVAIAADPPSYELFSDGRISDLSRLVLRAGEQIIFHSIGKTTTANAGIGAIAVARTPDRPDEVQVFARVVNWNSEPFAGDLEVVVDDRLRAVTPKPVEVPAAHDDATMGIRLPGETQVVFPSLALPKGGVIEVRFSAHDALVADDRATVVAAPPEALRVALVGRGAFVMRSILEGMSLAALELFSLSEWNDKMKSDPQTPDSFDVIVLDDAMPDTLTRGRYLIFHAPPIGSGISPYGTKENATPQSIRDEHPLLQYVNLDDLFVSSMTAVAAGGDTDVIVEAGDGPMIMTMNRGALTFVYVAFDPMDSDWPFQRGFVNFFANSIAWLAAGGSGVADEPLAPGDVAKARLPAGAKDIAVVLPDGRALPIIAQDPSNISYGPLRTSGIYRINWTPVNGQLANGQKGVPTLAYAVNMNSRLEGRVDAAAEIQFATERVAGIQGGRATESSAWPWLLLGAVAVLFLEWWFWLRQV